jgi:hypothetical protein
MQSAVTTSVFASTLNRLNHGWGCASFQIQAIKKTSRLVLSLPLVSDALLCGTTLSCSRHPFRWSVGDSLSTINTTINRLLLWHAQYNHTYLHLITFAPQTEHGPPKQSHLPPRAALHSSGLVRVEKPGTILSVKDCTNGQVVTSTSLWPRRTNMGIATRSESRRSLRFAHIIKTNQQLLWSHACALQEA